MKKLLFVSLLLTSFCVSAQKKISTPYFSFICECEEVENNYNPNNQSYNYSYQTKDGKSIYMISVKDSSVDQDSFLKAIKSSGTFNYKDTTFKGLKAIEADMAMNGQFVKHLGFFSKGKGYSVIIGSNSKKSTQALFAKFSNSLKLL